jgi:hypothetical protein
MALPPCTDIQSDSLATFCAAKSSTLSLVDVVEEVSCDADVAKGLGCQAQRNIVFPHHLKHLSRHQ